MYTKMLLFPQAKMALYAKKVQTIPKILSYSLGLAQKTLHYTILLLSVVQIL